jgi:hypothetical protein
VERRPLCDSARGSAFLSGAGFGGGGVGASVAFGQGTGVGEDDDRGTVVDGSRVGEVCLAEGGRGGEMHARGAERIGKRAVCGRRWVKVGSVLEAWAEGRPRHSKLEEVLDWGRWTIGGCSLQHRLL